MIQKVKSASSPQLSITLIKSISGRLPGHIATVRGLGLSKIGSKRVVRADDKRILGMIEKVSYLLAVEQIAS